MSTTDTDIIDTLLAGIARGDHDDRVREINAAASNRLRAIIQAERSEDAAVARASLREGGTAILSDTIRPKRLAGRRVRVVKINRTRAIVVLMGEPDHRFTGEVACPLSLLEAE